LSYFKLNPIWVGLSNEPGGSVWYHYNKFVMCRNPKIHNQELLILDLAYTSSPGISSVKCNRNDSWVCHWGI